MKTLRRMLNDLQANYSVVFLLQLVGVVKSFSQTPVHLLIVLSSWKAFESNQPEIMTVLFFTSLYRIQTDNIFHLGFHQKE